MSEIAVVGSAGFIGTRLSAQLGNPRLIDCSLPEHCPNGHRIDVRDRDRITRALEGVETVYLLAAEHADNVHPVSLYHDVNVGGAENIIYAAREQDIPRIVFTSSVAVYGLDAPGASENTPPRPFNSYGRSKWEAERKLVAWAEEDASRSLVIIRPCVVFGEGNRGNLYTLLRQLHSRRFVMVGKGRNKKSLAYVGNLVRFLAAFAKSKPGIQTFNYADKPDLEVGELVDIASRELHVRPPRLSLPYPVGVAAGYAADLASRITGRRFPISAVRVKKFCAVTTVNTDRLSSIGFRAPYGLEEGIRRMVKADLMVKPP